MRLLTESDVYRLLPMHDCIEIMRRTLQRTAEGGAINPLRRGILYPDGSGLLGLMPAYLPDPECAGVKVVSVTPGNHGSLLDAHQGAVLLFSVENGTLLAVIDATSLTAIRTAAVSAVATDLLANPDAKHLAIVGSGVQAMTHVEAMCEVRDIENVQVFSPNRARAQAFIDNVRLKCKVPVTLADSVADALRNADIVCTTTSAQMPVVRGEWIAPGTHINAVGACVKKARELDAATVAMSRLYTDRTESLENESGDYLLALEESAITREHLQGEIGDVLSGKVAGRNNRNEVTLFESLGIAVEDVGAAHFLWSRAQRDDIGLDIEFGGRRRS